MATIVVLAPDFDDLQQAAASGLVGGEKAPLEVSSSSDRFKIGPVVFLKSIFELRDPPLRLIL